MTPMQVLNQLYASKKIVIAFETDAARENFRQRIYKIKKTQDAAVTAILDEEKLVLHTRKEYAIFDISGELTIRNYRLVLWLEVKKAPEYAVISIEEMGDTIGSESGASSSDEEIPEDLANTNSKSSGETDKNSGS